MTKSWDAVILTPLILGLNVSDESIALFAKRAYLDYAMYVVLDRALPHVFDGLKPVQRRIVYAMHLLQLTAKAKYKKSSRTVGDVLGKFHPHGDQACYEAMVLMAQWFTTRYPLVDGQGNWGSVDDPKSFAAMRYTEARMTPFSNSLLQEVSDGGVRWHPNFDGTLSEPEVLPSQLPQVLLNGAYGIAVGMTTNIPPHNCREVVQCCLALLDNPDLREDQLLEHIPGPDFPTGAICISSKEAIKELYRTGEGTLVLRSNYHLEGKNIVFTQLPYRVSPARVLGQIAAEMQAKKLSDVVDLRDESDHQTPIRIVLELRSARVNAQEVVSYLFAVTDLEKQDRYVLNVIDNDRRPVVMSLAVLLRYWLDCRKKLVVKRSKVQLEKVLLRLEILDGLLTVFDFLDEVIAIIRTHEHPSRQLQKRFSLTEAQAEAILEMKLRALSKLQDHALRQQKTLLQEEKAKLEGIINDEATLISCVKKELEHACSVHQDARRTVLKESAQSTLAVTTAEQTTPRGALTVILSKQGWIRASKGHVESDGGKFRVGDSLQGVFHGDQADAVLLATEEGRFFSIKPAVLLGVRGQGTPLSQLIEAPSATSFPYVVWLQDLGTPLLLVSSEGLSFYCQLEDCVSRVRSGRLVMQVKTGQFKMLKPLVITDQSGYIASVSRLGRLHVCALSEIPYLKKGKGQKLMQLPDSGEEAEPNVLVQSVLLKAGQSLKIITGKRVYNMPQTVWESFIATRNHKGRLLPRGFRLVSEMLVEET